MEVIEPKPLSVSLLSEGLHGISIKVAGIEVAHLTNRVQLDWPAGDLPKLTLSMLVSKELALSLPAIVGLEVTHIYEGPGC